MVKFSLMVRRTSLLTSLAALLTAAGAVVGADVGADLPTNPYAGIAERNVFHLNAPPAPPDPEAAKPPPAKVFLTGISTFGRKRAMIKTAPSGKPGDQGKEKSYLLEEGAQQDDVKILTIDEVAGSVKLVLDGVEMTINFKDNAVASTATPATPAAPGATPGQHPGGGPGTGPGRATFPGMLPAPVFPGQPAGERAGGATRPIRGGDQSGRPMAGARFGGGNAPTAQ